MIATPAIAPREDFERLLDSTVRTLEITLRTAPSMGSFEFEDSVFRAMKQAADGTVFSGKIRKTNPGEFPDITAGRYYGVEAKQIHKDSTRTRGNSIFEGTRTGGVESVYLVMCWNASQQSKVAWRKYEDAIAGVVITHSPRYLLDVQLEQDEKLFDKLGLPYDEFRNLNQPGMMKKVRELYAGQDDNLWWIETRDRAPMQHFEALDNATKHRLIGEAFFLCPVVFGDDMRRKYATPMAYWLSQGFASQVIRDKFTSSGTRMIDGVYVPQIIARAIRHKNDILRAADSVDDELILQFWRVGEPPDQDDRIKQWLKHVWRYYSGNHAELRVLEDNFG